jgi:CheY-like chemotaxis protein
MMSSANILIVEDDALIALHLMELLLKEGFSVRDPIASGEELLDHLEKSTQTDIILMDIGLAGKIDGIETARQLRKKYDIPVIFLTAFSDQKNVEAMNNISSSTLLKKPIMEYDLLTTIRKVITDLAVGVSDEI